MHFIEEKTVRLNKPILEDHIFRCTAEMHMRNTDFFF